MVSAGARAISTEEGAVAPSEPSQVSNCINPNFTDDILSGASSSPCETSAGDDGWSSMPSSSTSTVAGDDPSSGAGVLDGCSSMSSSSASAATEDDVSAGAGVLDGVPFAGTRFR